MITSVEQLISALGGTNAVAALCGVKFNAVSHWRTSNALPDRHKYYLLQVCAEKGIEVDPAVFERRKAS